MIIDCPKCGECDFTLRLTKKMKLQCICNKCGESFKLKLAKKHRGIPLDRIRAEIEQIHGSEFEVSNMQGVRYKYETIEKSKVLQILDKYEVESEG
jgi:hypothetical protein